MRRLLVHDAAKQYKGYLCPSSIILMTRINQPAYSDPLSPYKGPETRAGLFGESSRDRVLNVTPPIY
jgi:hypothetical protein